MDYIVFARNARGVQGLRASRRARLDCPARYNRMPMRVPAGAEGARCAQRACGISPPFASICFRFSPLMSDFFQKFRRTNFKHVGGAVVPTRVVSTVG